MAATLLPERPFLQQEKRVLWEGPIGRTTMLVSRTVRKRQFAKRVFDVDRSTFALAGIKTINGGGGAAA